MDLPLCLAFLKTQTDTKTRCEKRSFFSGWVGSSTRTRTKLYFQIETGSIQDNLRCPLNHVSPAFILDSGSSFLVHIPLILHLQVLLFLTFPFSFVNFSFEVNTRSAGLPPLGHVHTMSFYFVLICPLSHCSPFPGPFLLFPFLPEAVLLWHSCRMCSITLSFPPSTLRTLSPFFWFLFYFHPLHHI